MENTELLFLEIRLLDQQIEELKQEIIQLEGRRNRFQDCVEHLVAQAENNLAGGE
jgi:prefoldin subunit 5